MRSRVLCLFIVGVSLIALGALSAIRQSHFRNIPLPVYGNVPAITLVDESGKQTSLASNEKQPWLLNLFYTSCDGPCPMTTARLSQLQKELPKIHFVSVSIDPNKDAPDKLLYYAHKFSADLSRWSFLTGSEDVINKLIVEDLKMATRDNPQVHATKVMLVDSASRIRGLYDLQDEISIKKLKVDINRVD